MINNAVSRIPGSGNAQLSDHNNRINALMPRDARFRWDYSQSSATSISIRGENYMSGSANTAPVQVYTPVRPLESGWVSTIERWIAIPEGTIQLANAGLGGNVGGLALAVSTDYLIWAFFTPGSNPQFIGYGATPRPLVTGATIVSGGGFGASTTIAIGAGNANRYCVGARVTVNVNTVTNSVHNQGTITAINIGGSTITVLLDPFYGGILQTNAVIPVATLVQVLQLDRFEPRVAGGTGNYGAYAYSYIGNVQTTAANVIGYARKRGEYYPALYLTAAGGMYAFHNLVANVGGIVCSLSRYVHFSTVKGYFTIRVLGGTAGAAQLGMDIQHLEQLVSTGAGSSESGSAPIGRFGRIALASVGFVGPINLQFSLTGWDEDNF